jgi:hypothetical protein
VNFPWLITDPQHHVLKITNFVTFRTYNGSFTNYRNHRIGYILYIQGTVDLLKQADATDAQIATAIAAGVTAESQSEGVLTRNWRPLVMLLITMLIVAWCFGYIPPNINAPMPPFIEECFEILKFGLGFYMSGRSLEKIAKTLLTPKLIETMLKNISK